MKILAHTSIRSDYDLMYYLYKRLNVDSFINFGLVVGGAHLSKMYGYTVTEIEKDSLPIIAKIECLLNSDSKVARIKSAAIYLNSLIEVMQSYSPDLAIVVGDREDALMFAIGASYLEIPTLHFFGGDHSCDSHIDNPVRHAISKLASVHFVANDEHALRLKLMGENPNRIFVIGSVSLDKFKEEETMSLEELQNYFNLTKMQDYAIVIFHPVPLEREISGVIFERILKSIKQKGLLCFVSYPNIDPGNFRIIEVLNYIKHDNNFIVYKNLPRKIFVNLYRYAKFIVGNSSSGVVESASIPIPAINVGIRQQLRSKNSNVIYCGITEEEINSSITLVLSEEYRRKITGIKNLYGDGNSSQIAYELIKSIKFEDLKFKNEDPITLLKG